MNKNLTELAFVLDRSGSMASVTEAAIAGFNDFLREQQKVEGQARLTLVLFDDEYLVALDGIPAGEAVPLDTRTYVPRGSTALLDAIGTTIDRLGERLAALPEPQRPGVVLVAILTDGYENASQKFTWKDISRRIREQTDVYKWQFLFLGAGQDAIATAAQLSIDPNNASQFAADSAGIRSSQRGASRKMSAMRKMSLGHAMTCNEKADAVVPLRKIVAEEDASERRKG